MRSVAGEGFFFNSYTKYCLVAFSKSSAFKQHRSQVCQHFSAIHTSGAYQNYGALHTSYPNNVYYSGGRYYGYPLLLMKQRGSRPPLKFLEARSSCSEPFCCTDIVTHTHTPHTLNLFTCRRDTTSGNLRHSCTVF